MYLSITRIITKFAVSRPATRLYPFVKRVPYKNTRGSIAIDISTCIFCSICQKKCPSLAIKVSKPEKNWSIDRLKCIQCGACVDVCPKKCLRMENMYSAPVAHKSVDLFKQEPKTQV